MITRRTFIVTGLAGTAALVTAYWMNGRSGPSLPLPRNEREAAGTVLAALAPVMLAGALPTESQARKAALEAAVGRVQATIASLPAASRRELAQLFALLTWAPTRLAFAGLARPWSDVDPSAISEVLESWRGSRLELKRSAYAALHQLVLGAWYAGPESWSSIGYPGPPQL